MVNTKFWNDLKQFCKRKTSRDGNINTVIMIEFATVNITRDVRDRGLYSIQWKNSRRSCALPDRSLQPRLMFRYWMMARRHISIPERIQFSNYFILYIPKQTLWSFPLTNFIVYNKYFYFFLFHYIFTVVFSVSSTAILGFHPCLQIHRLQLAAWLFLVRNCTKGVVWGILLKISIISFF